MKRRISLLLTAIVMSSILTGCFFVSNDDGKPDINVDRESDNKPEVSDSNQVVGDGKFEACEILQGEPYQYDLDGDGEKDTISVDEDYNDARGYSFYSLSAKDTKLDLITDGNSFDFQYPYVYFIHNDDTNYLVTSLTGDGAMWLTMLYKWENGEFKYVDEEMDYKVYDVEEFTEDSMVLGCVEDGFGSFVCTRVFTYGKDGFSTTDDDMIIANTTGICLARDMTFTDGSGNDAKSAKTGDIVFPTTFSVKTDAVGFEDMEGNFLGYLEFELKYDENDLPVRYVDGVSEYDIFESIPYAG